MDRNARGKFAGIARGIAQTVGNNIRSQALPARHRLYSDLCSLRQRARVSDFHVHRHTPRSQHRYL